METKRVIWASFAFAHQKAKVTATMHGKYLVKM